MTLSLYCHIRNDSQTSSYKQRSFCGWGIQEWLSWTPCFRVSHSLQSSCQLELQHLEFSWSRVCSQAHSVFLGGIFFLISCQTECLSSLLSIGRGHPFFSVVWPSPPEQACEKSQREYEQDGNHSLLWPNNRGAAHHSCHVLFVRRESPDLAHT